MESVAVARKKEVQRPPSLQKKELHFCFPFGSLARSIEAITSMTQSSPMRKSVEGGSRDTVQETAAYSSLQIALIFNAFVSWTFAILV